MKHSEQQPNEISRDVVSELLRIAGARPAIDESSKQRVEQAVRMAWRNGLRRRRLHKLGYALAAGCVAIAAGVGVRQLHWATASTDVAVVVNVHGRVSIQDGAKQITLAVGDRLPEGSVIVTSKNALVALSLERIASVRLDQDTQLVLHNDRRVELRQGAVYLDSGARAGGVRVETPLFAASDTGTRFMVRHQRGGDSHVSVRDGAVEVDIGSINSLRAGEGMQVNANGQLRRIAVQSHGPDWNWTRAAAVPFAPQGRSIEEFLRWYAHETGLTLTVDPEPLLQQRLRAPLQGDLFGLTAEELLEVAAVAGAIHVGMDKKNGVMHVSK